MRLAIAPIRRSRIPLTSLVDVIFILLFFFMLAAHDLAWRALRVDLARPASGDSQVGSSPVVALKVVMLANGELSLRGQRVSRSQLLAEIDAGPRARAVVLVPGRGVDVQALVNLLDAIAPSGIPVLLGSIGAAP